MKKVFYVAHPVSGDPLGNVKKVVGWIKWFTINVPQHVFIAPWVAEVIAFSDDIGTCNPAFYDRVLADDCDVVCHLDGVVMVGGSISRGMGIERDAALAAGKEVVDWSAYFSTDLIPPGHWADTVEPTAQVEPAPAPPAPAPEPPAPAPESNS